MATNYINFSNQVSPSESSEITGLVQSPDAVASAQSINNESQKKLKYPKSVFFIVANEFCERFSYYGMKTVLTLYLRNILKYDEDYSTVIYHLFSGLCYFFPVFGAILADSYLGKFKTILYLSILYAFGNILLSVSAIPNLLPQGPCSLVGLFIIAVGTGGIKPCVSAFGGDQFVRPQQERQLEQFFSVFYFSINAGSLISTYVTPYLREKVHCFGDESCFPLAFGVPAILMIVALALFVFGKPSYKILPPEGNVVVDVSKCIGHAIGRKMKSKGEKRDHWLDFASDKFDAQLIKDIKQVLRVLVLYLPIPVFWALFDQQGSRWTFQATRMDGTLGSMTILPDQLQIVNPLFILALVPIFEAAIYPLFAKCGLLTPLQRIGVGGLLAALAFVISGIVELNLEPTYAKIPEQGHTHLNFINTLPCPISVSFASGITDEARHITVNATSYSIQHDLEDKPLQVRASVNNPICGDLTLTQSTEWSGLLQGASEKSYSVVITSRDGKVEVVRMEREDPLQKSSSGLPRVTFIFSMGDDLFNEGNITIRSADSKSIHFPFNALNSTSNQQLSRLVGVETHVVDIGMYDVFVPHKDGRANGDDSAGKVNLKQGGCYVILIQRPLTGASTHQDDLFMTMEVTPANSVHMLWLVPQFFVITVAEVMFSVTGNSFSFTQAPASMRAVMAACWLLTIAFGNVIVILVATAKGIPRQSMEFFLFAGLMVLDMLLFFFLASSYTYVVVEDKDSKPSAIKEDKGSENKGFTDTSM